MIGELSCTSPFDGWAFADCGIKRTLRCNCAMGVQGERRADPGALSSSRQQRGTGTASRGPKGNARFAIRFEHATTGSRRRAGRARATGTAATARGFRQPLPLLKPAHAARRIQAQQSAPDHRARQRDRSSFCGSWRRATSTCCCPPAATCRAWSACCGSASTRPAQRQGRARDRLDRATSPRSGAAPTRGRHGSRSTSRCRPRSST